MRAYLLSLAVVLSSVPALAQPKKSGLREFQGQSEAPTKESQAAARRRAAGLQDMQEFGAQKKAPEKPFPWIMLAVLVTVAGILTPFAWKLFKSTRQDLDDNMTFGLKGSSREREAAAAAGGGVGKRPPARMKGKPGETRIIDERSPRDAVWDAISTSKSWVSAEWVASSARLKESEVADELSALTEEGYVQENRDKAGKSVYRVVS